MQEFPSPHYIWHLTEVFCQWLMCRSLRHYVISDMWLRCSINVWCAEVSVTKLYLTSDSGVLSMCGVQESPSLHYVWHLTGVFYLSMRDVQESPSLHRMPTGAAEGLSRVSAVWEHQWNCGLHHQRLSVQVSRLQRPPSGARLARRVASLKGIRSKKHRTHHQWKWKKAEQKHSP